MDEEATIVADSLLFDEVFVSFLGGDSMASTSITSSEFSNGEFVASMTRINGAGVLENLGPPVPLGVPTFIDDDKFSLSPHSSRINCNGSGLKDDRRLAIDSFLPFI